MRGGGVEVAREENGASLEGEERGVGVFLERGGGDEHFGGREDKLLLYTTHKITTYYSAVLC